MEGACPIFEEESSQRRITDLLPELALRICGFLDVPDLVNVCESIPGWRWILTTCPFPTLMCHHINQWTWLDKRLCQLMFPQPSPTSFQSAPEAIRYEKEQRDSYECFMSRPARGKAPRTAHFSILPDHDVSAMSEEEFALRMEASKIPLFGYISMIKCRSHTRIVGMHGCIYSGQSAERGRSVIVRKTRFVGEGGGHDCCDCIIYLADASRFLRDDFAAVVESLAPHQTLAIAVIINGKRDESNEMDCLVRFIRRLGGFDGSVLAGVSANWRLWCIKRHEGSFTNWSNLLEWGFYDVMRKRVESGQERDWTKNSKLK
ncbi:hypothetical protein TSMEX_003257 [Taenia solium]|eukprot:TsM_001166600 transcript=TsM_001166600 gene=TsM_001166600